jgi:hypothetical protein
VPELTATVECAFEECPWSAQMSGDDAIEIAKFLRALVIEHCNAHHPEHAEVTSHE